MTAREHEVRIPVGRTAAGGELATIPLYPGATLLITGGPGTGKSTLARGLATRAGAAGLDIGVYSPQDPSGATGLTSTAEAAQWCTASTSPGTRLLVLDDAESELRTYPDTWARLLGELPRHEVAVAVVVSSLHLACFGDSEAVRTPLRSGSIVRFRTTEKWDVTHERLVDLTAVPRYQAWLQNPADDRPRHIFIDYT